MKTSNLFFYWKSEEYSEVIPARTFASKES